MLIFNSRLHVVVSNQSIGPWLVNSIFYINVLLAVGAAEYARQHVLVVWLVLHVKVEIAVATTDRGDDVAGDADGCGVDVGGHKGPAVDGGSQQRIDETRARADVQKYEDVQWENIKIKFIL